MDGGDLEGKTGVCCGSLRVEVALATQTRPGSFFVSGDRERTERGLKGCKTKSAAVHRWSHKSQQVPDPLHTATRIKFPI